MSHQLISANRTSIPHDLEQLVTEILVALDEWLYLPAGPDVDDARAAVMRELLTCLGPAGTWLMASSSAGSPSSANSPPTSRHAATRTPR
jgi:hypothetical protein